MAFILQFSNVRGAQFLPESVIKVFFTEPTQWLGVLAILLVTKHISKAESPWPQIPFFLNM